MRYVLFLCGRVGYEAIRIFAEHKCRIVHVFVESEHAHEHEKFCEKLIKECEKNGIRYYVDAKRQEIEECFSQEIKLKHSPDYIMSFGYRKMIPSGILKSAKVAALGTHFSPLPRYRGFAPLNWLLINGEEMTAVNLFILEEEVDSGDILDQELVRIDYGDDINSLLSKCILAFRKVMSRVIPKLEQARIEARRQDSSLATYTCARSPEDGLIEWNWPARRIYNFVRAQTYPYPGAYTYIGERKLVVWSCEEYEIPEYVGRIPGKVIKLLEGRGVAILCGEGAILLKSVQLGEGTQQTADKCIRSVRLTLGRRSCGNTISG